MSSYKQQTSVQDAAAIRVGSVKLEIGPYGGGYSDIGALRNAAFLESFDPITIKSDNAGVIEEGVQNHVVEITGDWLEINIENLGKVYEGLATDGTTSAAPDSVTDEAVTLNLYEAVELASAQGDGTIVTSVSVTSISGGGITYVQDCDYILFTKPNGKSAIARAYATVIEGTNTDKIAVDGTAETYTLSVGTWDKTPAIGDHITFAGFAESANNGVKTVTAATDTVITVSDDLTTEAEGATITATMGGIATGATVYVNYSFTPEATRTYTTGGKTTRDALMVRLTNTNVAGEDWIMTVYKAYVMDGLKYNFLPDDDPEKMVIPIRLQGVIDSTRTSGDQLFSISDAQDHP